MTLYNLIMRKSISILLMTALILSGFFITPKTAHATMVEKTVTKYHLDIGAQHIWGHGTSIDTATWDHPKGGTITVPTQTITFPQNVSNVKVYPYLTNQDKFKWGEDGYSFNSNGYLNGQGDFDDNYKDFVSNSISNIKSSSSGSNVSFSYTATLASKVDFDLKEKLKYGKLSFILEVLGGEESVKYTQPTVYDRLIAGSNNQLANDVYGFMYFTPVIIQYDVTEMVEVEDPKPEEIDADLDAPASAKTGETFNVADTTRVGSETILKSSTLYKSVDNADWEQIATWNGNGQKGQNTAGKIAQSFSEVCTVRYKIVSETTGGVEDEEIKTTTIEDGTVVDAKATLSLPRYTYEGHPVTAEDESTYNVKGISYSAERAYAEGYATNKFTIVESGAGSIHKNNKEPIYATAVFPTRGDYNVLLKISPKNGSSLYDTQPITVLKTPTITATLGGKQKQNRKQTLDIKVATSPDHALTTLYVTLTNTRTGESVTLYNNVDGSVNTLSNSDNIKTRAIIKQDSDEYFTNCQLQFLTKDGEQTVYSYKVYAKDSIGNWDSVEEEFTVVPDTPPDPKISIQDTFFRAKESNVAKLEAEDVSTTDGDQLERTWYVTDDTDVDESFSDETEVLATSVSGYQDCAFGTQKDIEFNKTGVGKLKLRLHVKDIWTEETLPEYISDSDYLTAETTAVTTVINIAPVVSLLPITTRTMDILLLADGKDEYTVLKNSINTMQAKFLGNAIDANIKIEQLDSPFYANTPQYQFMREQEYMQAGRDTSFESNSFSIDNKRMYTLDATWYNNGEWWYNAQHTYPYTIRAYDALNDGARNQNLLWNFTITQGCSVPISTTFRFAHDDTDTYLYYVCNGKTALFTKDNGTLLTVLNFEVGAYNFVNNAYIFTFKGDGLYRINRKTGAVKKIETFQNGGVAKRLDGKVQFLTISNLRMKRGIFNTETEQTTYEVLPDANKGGYSLVGIDSQGKLIITGGEDTLVYSRSNFLLSTIGGGNAKPVYNTSGVCNYIAYATRHSSSNYKHVYVNVGNVITGSVAGYDHRSSSSYVTSDHIIGALQFDNGKVYVITGTDPSNGAGGAGTMYDPDTNTASKVSEGYLGMGGSYQFGLSTDTLISGHEGSGTSLSRIPQTMSTILIRNLNKDMEKDKDTYMVGLYSNSSTAVEDAEINSIVQKLKSLGIEYYFLTKDTVSGYGQAIADKMGDIGKTFFTTTPAESMADDIIAQEKTGTVMAIKSTANNGYLKKNAKLGLNKKYYYEYDIKPNTTDNAEIKKDIFTNNLAITPTVSESYLTSSRLEVADVLQENFTTYTLDERLTSSSDTIVDESPRKGSVMAGGITTGGRYGSAVIIDHGSNSTRNVTTTLSVKVPSGQRAIVSFYWESRINSARGLNTYVNAGGYMIKPFDTYTMEKKSGNYQCPGFMSGNFNITISATQGGKWGDSYMYIDNLQIIYINDSPAGTQNYSINNGKDGWSTVSGTFRSPASIAYYRGLQSWVSPSNYTGVINTGGINYVPAASFDGSSMLGFTLPTSGENYKIRNLKVYYEENGKKVYAVNETFNRQEAISAYGKYAVETSLVTEAKDTEEKESLVYKKGELVPYSISYYDYENDPSKKQYWRYTHTPFNDGPHPDAVTILDADGRATAGPGTVLNAPITRFYVDGKYTVEHWQEDDTSRGAKTGGNPLYDKASNIETITFYIVGGASAPWITGISTSPTTVKENTYFSLNIGIDDAEKDILNLTTEVYKDKKLIFTHRKKNIYPIDSKGNTTTDAAIAVGYPNTNTGALPDKALAGKYQVVATVRDQTGAGFKEYIFYVISDGKITGYVNHTDKWDQNRKKYNLSWFGNEINTAYTYSDYMALSLPRRRGTNVFWSGEKFMLRAAVAGSPIKVTCNMEGYSYSTSLKSTGTKNGDGEVIYTGSIWNEDMVYKWGFSKPELLTFTFTATYSGGTSKTHKETIIIDNMNPYWKLHRVY